MLRAELYVNLSHIDRMSIVRIGSDSDGMCRYRCEWQGSHWEVHHHYNEGAWRLIAKAVGSMPPEAHIPPHTSKDADAEDSPPLHRE